MHIETQISFQLNLQTHSYNLSIFAFYFILKWYMRPDRAFTPAHLGFLSTLLHVLSFC